MASQNPNQILLVVADIGIRQDAEGRYCLNDLHKAAGSAAKHKPGNWLMLGSTKELAHELSDTGNPASEQNQALKVYKGGNDWQGTFVSKDLVYDYAMWISAAFKVKVIRAYDALVTQDNPAGHLARFDIPKTYPDALRLAADLVEKNEEQQRRIADMEPKVFALERISSARGSLCLTDAAKNLQITRQELIDYLSRNRWIYRRKPTSPWTGFQDKLDAGYLEHKVSTVSTQDGVARIAGQVRVTPPGLSVLAQLFNQIEMPLFVGQEAVLQ